ncbi:hypothetical protein N7520_002264 [Penicillium odoratum]|uniref:uncharacterized protein n=1 Tax=Penicillium odoratum TaxID=1167516 RepID=UPI002546710E|nr:uncharacterized protein N7520_002264 [Penicillium odoratum]KAJ5771735.1 hypothetical protein N7520_002264 [Penicillium odoratum]
MSKNASNFNFSGNNHPASECTRKDLEGQDHEAEQQTHTRVKQDTGHQYQPGQNGDEHTPLHLHGTQNYQNSIIAHEKTSMTRNATYSHFYDHLASEDQVNDTTLPAAKRNLNENSFVLGELLAMDGRRQHSEAISDDQVHHDAVSTTMQRLHDNTCALVAACSARPASQANETCDHIKTPRKVNDNNNVSPTMLATLQDQAYMPIGHPIEVIRKQFQAESHKLAYEVPETRGAIQTGYPSSSNAEVTRDIGWHKANLEIPDPLIGGYTNEELFAFIRRFNKDIFDVKAVPIVTASGLDLNDAWSQDHAGDKVALHLQRLYLSGVLGIASLWKHISRLRSWNETLHTSIFCGIYFSAWFFNLLMPLALGTLILVVSSVKARKIICPPAPRALVNTRTGEIQEPQAGLLGTNDTLTGAPEKQLHEAVEEEAASFAKNIRHNLQRAVGMHCNPQSDGDGDPLEGKIPKPIRKTVKAIQSAGSAPGHVTECTGQTQQPMEEIIWAGVNPETITKALDNAPHAIGELADNWERFANALTPTPPFSRFAFLRILVVLVPLFLVSLFVNYYIVYKGTGLAIGFAIFGDPLLTRTMAWLKRNIPNYMELAQPKNNLLYGVPTNTQIAITLLRIGEAQKTPLPPVPISKPSDPDRQNPIDVENIPLPATHSEVLDAAVPSVVEKPHSEDKEEKPKHEHLSKLARFFKGGAKSVVEAKLTVDHVRATAGSQKAKDRVGVLPKAKSIIYAGPSEYQCRFEGQSGWAVITQSPRLSVLFTRDDPRLKSSRELKRVFEIAVNDIYRLKRATAFENSGLEAVVALSSDEKLLASLEIEDEDEKIWKLTVVPERDELFNRLVAAGNQRWEIM